MAKRERNKRSARKARQQERERVAAAQEISKANEPSKTRAGKKTATGRTAVKKTAVAKSERQGLQKVTGYFGDVRAEMHQVTWPTRLELRNYSVAVIVTLIVFGLLIWLVDTGFVAGLVQFTNLRG